MPGIIAHLKSARQRFRQDQPHSQPLNYTALPLLTEKAINNLNKKHAFWPFPYMPPEIRDRIWFYSLPSARLIKMGGYEGPVNSIPTAHRVLMDHNGWCGPQTMDPHRADVEFDDIPHLKACAESSRAARKNYKLIPSERFDQKRHKVHIDPEVDIPYFTCLRSMTWIMRNPWMPFVIDGCHNWQQWSETSHLTTENDPLLHCREIIIDLRRAHYSSETNKQHAYALATALRLWPFTMSVFALFPNLESVIVLGLKNDESRRVMRRWVPHFQTYTDMFMAMKRQTSPPDAIHPWGEGYRYKLPNITVMSKAQLKRHLEWIGMEKEVPGQPEGGINRIKGDFWKTSGWD